MGQPGIACVVLDAPSAPTTNSLSAKSIASTGQNSIGRGCAVAEPGSGRHDLETGGPSISPPFDASDIIVGASSGLGWQKSDESQASRRSVYVFAKRAIPLPEFRLLGMADPSVSTSKRVVATTAVQALVMFNGRLVHEQAGILAKRLVADVGDQPENQVRRLVELALCREATAEERQMLVRFLTEHPRDAQRDAGGIRVALQSLCLVILNTNEFVYMN